MAIRLGMSGCQINLKDEGAQVFQAVGPSRIGALALIALRMGRTDDSAGAEARRVAHDRLARACEMLADGFPRALDTHSLEETAELRRARLGAIAVLSPIVDGDEYPCGFDPSDVDAFLRYCLTEVDPIVSRFLNLMTAFFDEAQARRDERRRRDALRAVREAKTLGNAIEMVAVNARIEAGRCGQAGDGFKVIAAEVKRLAERTHAVLDTLAAALNRQ